MKTLLPTKMALSAIVLLALSFHSAIPAGFMPSKSSDGVLITICTGFGVQTIVLDPDTGEPAQDRKAPTGLCLYAASLHHSLLSAISTPLSFAIAYGRACASKTSYRDRAARYRSAAAAVSRPSSFFLGNALLLYWCAQYVRLLECSERNI